jgi:formate dehydrogenase
LILGANKRRKILCVLYEDPATDYPDSYARAGVPLLEQYPDGMKLATPAKVDFHPGKLSGCVSGALGLHKF